MIYAVDFDGTLCENAFPEIGEPDDFMLAFLSGIHKQGHQWILYTMREGKYLQDALDWLKERGFVPDAVNDNLPSMIERFGNNPRKVYADFYVDDHNITTRAIKDGRCFVPPIEMCDMLKRLGK